MANDLAKLLIIHMIFFSGLQLVIQMVLLYSVAHFFLINRYTDALSIHKALTSLKNITSQ